ncbi:MAG: ABC transporter substrate-binding protein [Erysipelotrichaceae bacterium]
MRIGKILLMLCLIGSMLGACATKEETVDLLTIAIPEQPNSLVPTRLEGREAGFVQAQLFETLIQYRDKEFVPLLAEGLPVCDESGTKCVVSLKSGITFHDGTTFDSASVVYSLMHLIEAQSTDWTDSIKEVKALDATHVEISMNYPDGTLFSKLANPMFAMIPADSDENAKLDEFPIGTGPYKFVSGGKNKTIKLTRYDNYHGEKALIGEVAIVKTEINDALTMLRDGEVQIVLDVPSDAEDELNALDDVKWVQGDTTATAYLGIRMQSMANVKLEKKEFRRALMAAIDLDALTSKTGSSMMDNLFGKGVFGDSPIELEYGSTSESWLGEDILLATSIFPEDFKLGDEIKDALENGGFTRITISELSQSDLSTALAAEKSFDLTVFVWEYALADGGDFLDALMGVDAINPLRIQHPEIDSLLLSVDRSVDPALRKDALMRIEEILVEEGVLLPLTKVVRHHALSTRLTDPSFLSDGSIRISNLAFSE